MIGKRGSRRGQVTIFIIIAIVIVAIVLVYLAVRGGLVGENIPASIQPAYTSFISCLEDQTQTGINVLESQGGYIDLPPFEPGSSYMPFSSQLSLAGNPIPYWYYISGNNIEKEQVPTRQVMEEQLADFIESNIADCDLQNYYDEGFLIKFTDAARAEIQIEAEEVEVNLNMPLVIEKGNDTARVETHKISYTSKLGALHEAAIDIYEEENDAFFLENYTIDVLRNYAPVDGTEISCSPLVWNAEEVFDDIQEAIDANIPALKNRGEEEDYFSLELPTEEEVKFLTSKDWPHSFEVLPADSQILTATPVGNQPGLGILGFCYVAYHFVYNLHYPVLVQVGSPEEEIFQFPLAVVVRGNQPRESLEGADAVGDLVPELCRYKNTEVEVRTYNSNFQPVEADISYTCFGNTCNIGQTSSSDGSLRENFPQCANGYIVATAPGFKETRYLFSTVQSGNIDVIMERTYETEIELFLDGRRYDGNAIVTITADYGTRTLAYPGQRTVQLGEGSHDIEAQYFSNTTIYLGETTKEQCVEVPHHIFGIFGLTKDRCFQVEVPEQTISQALSGGGKANRYLLESDLAQGKKIEIDAPSLPAPDSIDDISNNYLVFEQSTLEVEMV